MAVYFYFLVFPVLHAGLSFAWRAKTCSATACMVLIRVFLSRLWLASAEVEFIPEPPHWCGGGFPKAISGILGIQATRVLDIIALVAYYSWVYNDARM